MGRHKSCPWQSAERHQPALASCLAALASIRKFDPNRSKLWDSPGTARSQLSLRVAGRAEGGSPCSPAPDSTGPPSPPRASPYAPALAGASLVSSECSLGPGRLNLPSQSPGLIKSYNLCRKYDLYLISPHCIVNLRWD